ncbi:hypothetical protein LWI29_017230 [Acer saccharum]|uniref:Uncharacterized protein n=1 Tax=Acer saccharum TaxID=4024 RepID=A0AA39TMS7_ACESA|nr:hypothetical protein LWI29_017230 [Acer saccharum]
MPNKKETMPMNPLMLNINSLYITKSCETISSTQPACANSTCAWCMCMAWLIGTYHFDESYPNFLDHQCLKEIQVLHLNLHFEHLHYHPHSRVDSILHDHSH